MSNYIDIKGKTLIPYDESFVIGDKVVSKNLNGNWYTGILKSIPKWHDCILSYKGKRKFGIAVNEGPFTLIKQQEEIFKILW